MIQIDRLYEKSDAIPEKGFHLSKDEEGFLVWVIKNSNRDDFIGMALFCLRKLDRPEFLKVYQNALWLGWTARLPRTLFESILVLRDIGEDIPPLSLGINDYGTKMNNIARDYIAKVNLTEIMENR